MKKFMIALTLLCTLAVLGACNSSHLNSKKNGTKQITIYIARHGKTMLNTTDHSQGWSDAPLTPAGIKVAEDLGKGLSDIKFDSVYSSDSGRAIETASIILKNNGQKNLVNKINRDQRLREFNFGTFEGVPSGEMWSSVAKKEGLTLAQWQTNMRKKGFISTIKDFSDTLNKLDKEKLNQLGKSAKIPSNKVSWLAEDYNTVVARSNKALEDIVTSAKKNNSNNILIVSHGMTISALVSSLDNSVKIPSTGLGNASICKITYEIKSGKFFVKSVNDLSYVEDGEKQKEQ
ncbi:histidine phosphatase family protein [Lactococcus kimchii]|uniref:histidine phosphatase family protein n=1 Tax=Lactococcus sp. S-13 TaxID=2507158 RepID=UPI0010232AB2|nr:histidine phosphatase family protein [Lactococcus sp. S-13]RZI48205.1 histidine phosphatase family protein [Lactococcus sp. S-13]